MANKKLSPIEELRRKLSVHKNIKKRTEEIIPETMPNKPEKIYLVYKKHKELKHNVMRFNNGVVCIDCNLNIKI